MTDLQNPKNSVIFFRDQKYSLKKGAAMQSSQCKLRQSLATVKLNDVLSAFYM